MLKFVLCFDMIKKDLKDPEPGRPQKDKTVDTSQPSILNIDYTCFGFVIKCIAGLISNPGTVVTQGDP